MKGCVTLISIPNAVKWIYRVPVLTEGNHKYPDRGQKPHIEKGCLMFLPQRSIGVTTINSITLTK